MLIARSFDRKSFPLVLIVALLCLVLGSACSDPDMPKNVVVPSNDVALDRDSETSDIGDIEVDPADVDSKGDADGDSIADVEGDVAVQSDAETDIGEGQDIIEPNAYPRCGPVVDLGWLMPGKQSLSVDFATLENHLETGCANAKSESNEAVFSFRLSDEGMLNLTSSLPVASELRRSPCENNELALLCKDDGLSDKVSGAGVWFLVIEQLDESPAEAVDIELELVPTPLCDDAGTARCLDANTIETCDVTASSPDLVRLTRGVCAQGCVNDQCVGDSCDAPIVVTERIKVEGNSAVYFDNHDSRVGDSCHVEENNYHEPELVFELPDLKTGNKVVVESTGEFAPYNILFKSSCAETSACLGYFEESSPVSWEVPSDGTYYVIVENGGWVPGSFQIAVEIKQD